MCRVFECVKLSSALLWIHELDTSPLWLGFYSFRICSPTGKLLDSVWFMIFMWFSCLSCNCAWISKQTISASGLPQCTAMNQGGREFYIHQSQEAEKWHCLVTRKRLYIQRERVGERGESTLQTGFAVLGIFAQATQGTQSVHKHMTSIVTWCDMIIIAVSDPNTCTDSACERGDILHRLMPMWTSAASGTNLMVFEASACAAIATFLLQN